MAIRRHLLPARTVVEGQHGPSRLLRSTAPWRPIPQPRALEDGRLISDHTVVTAGFGSGANLTVTSRTSDGQTIIAYVPNGNAATLTVDMTKITSAIHQATCLVVQSVLGGRNLDRELREFWNARLYATRFQ